MRPQHHLKDKKKNLIKIVEQKLLSGTVALVSCHFICKTYYFSFSFSFSPHVFAVMLKSLSVRSCY